MQVTGSSATKGLLPSTSSALKQASSSDFANLANYSDSQNTIFQNLLKDPDVADNISTDANGNYVFTFNQKGAISHQEQMARLLIIEQTSEKIAPPEGNQTPYSVAELARFRQLTGYNLIQVSATMESSGVYTLADDFGRTPAAADADFANAMWEAFDWAKAFQDIQGGAGQDLTKQSLKDALAMMRDRHDGNENLYETMIDLVESSWPQDDQVSV